MVELFIFGAFLVLWLVFQLWLGPRLGLPT